MEIDENFWREFNAPAEYNEFLIAIVTRIITGEDLTKIDKDKLFKLIFTMAFTNGMTPDDFKIKIRKFRQSIPNFLTTLDTVLNEVQAQGLQMYRRQNSMLLKVANLPPLANSFDPEVVIEFIRTLDKDAYSFLEAERLLGITRQTLRKYADEGKYGLTIEQRKKRIYLTKKGIVDFYRERYIIEHGDNLFN